jgi:acetylornithine deacetylase/succinyl-diaminopimelate desuccinylase-like protein
VWRRRAWALALGLAIGTAPVSPAHAIWPFGGGDHPDPSEDLAGAAASILGEAIRFRTVNPPGDEAPLAAYLTKVLRRHGVEARVVDTPPGDSGEGRAAVWARVPGSGRGRPIVLHSHLDVVPAAGAEWAVDPFGGVVGGGYVIGRGALDAKGIAVVHLLTLVELAQRARPLDRDVILLATPDEETGGADGAGFLVRERRSLLHDAEYLLTEGGGILVPESGAPAIWGVAVTEKTPCWIRVVAHGTGGHASTEPVDAAVPRLVAALERVRTHETELRVVPEVARMFATLAPLAAESDRAALASLGPALSRDAAFRERFLADRGQNALVRNTVSITVLSGALKTNVLPEEASAELDARLLPGESCEAFTAGVRETIDDPMVSVEPILAFAARSSPVDTELFRAIVRVAAEVDPGALVVPRVIAGFTDAHYFRDAGIVSYGFVPRWLPVSESRGIHGTNERISTQNLERGVRTLVRILEVLGNVR